MAIKRVFGWRFFSQFSQTFQFAELKKLNIIGQLAINQIFPLQKEAIFYKMDYYKCGVISSWMGVYIL
jgi:hypothetical protein